MTYMIEGRPMKDNEQDTSAPSVSYSASPGLTNFLTQQAISLAFTSYQSGKLYLLGRNGNGGLHVNERVFGRAMGLATQGSTLVLASQYQILRFENVLEPGELVNDLHDACFVPRQAWITGSIDAHDVGIREDGEVVFVNTLYNCLATRSERKSFRPVWKPRFISAIVQEDRCHLNGMAMDKGRPAFVSAVSRSDTIDGWRDRRASGGVVIDVNGNAVVAEGLSMPHSPRVHEGQLWVLNSGTGELGRIDPSRPAGEAFLAHAFCPGFLRGLAFHRHYAIVGLSKPRYQRFEGLALDDRLAAADSEPWCGIQIIDLVEKRCVEWFRIDGAVTELYDVAALPGIASPTALGFASRQIETFITHEPLSS